MKNLATSFTLLVFSYCYAFSQSWCPTGATWHHDWVTIAPMTGYVKMEYTNDTTILSISCKKLQKTLYGYNFSSQQFFSQYIGSEFTYEAGNVIYVFDTTDVDFDTLVNLNALIGSSWTMPQRSVASFCENQSSVTVLDTGSRVVNGQSLKWIYVNNVFDPNNANISYTDTIYEKIGSTQWYFLPFPFCEESVDLDNGGKLRCYVDDFFPMYNQTTNGCDYTVGINESDIVNELSPLSVFPNPANEYINFQPLNSNVNYHFSVFNSVGQIVETGNFNNSFSLNTLNWQTGVYYILFTDRDRRWNKKIVKVK